MTVQGDNGFPVSVVASREEMKGLSFKGELNFDLQILIRLRFPLTPTLSPQGEGDSSVSSTQQSSANLLQSVQLNNQARIFFAE